MADFFFSLFTLDALLYLIVNWSSPDSWMNDGPNFQHGMVNEVVLDAGDGLYLPTFWFHFIVSLTLNYQCNARSGVSYEYQSHIRDCGFGWESRRRYVLEQFGSKLNYLELEFLLLHYQTCNCLSFLLRFHPVKLSVVISVNKTVKNPSDTQAIIVVALALILARGISIFWLVNDWNTLFWLADNI